MKNNANLAILAVVALPLSVAPKGLHAATPQTPQATAMEARKGALNLEYHNGRLSIEARDATLGTLLNAVTERTGVPFNVSDGTLRQDRITLSIEDRPLAEAIPLMLVGYNVLNVWDEKMTPLQVNVLGRSAANPTPGGSGTERRVALTAHSASVTETSAQKNHPRSAAPPDPAKIESALEDLRSQDSSRRLTALNEVVGGDDARIAPAILDVALAGPTGDPATASNSPGGGSVGGKSKADISENDLAFKAALSLWRHGLERGFADEETIEALRMLEARGNPVTSAIAKRAWKTCRPISEACLNCSVKNPAAQVSSRTTVGVVPRAGTSEE